jgi:hypothetical protein
MQSRGRQSSFLLHLFSPPDPQNPREQSIPCGQSKSFLHEIPSCPAPCCEQDRRSNMMTDTADAYARFIIKTPRVDLDAAFEQPRDFNAGAAYMQ